jgi:protein-S-isoprenylcysteine O-methyltransferase Ste14
VPWAGVLRLIALHAALGVLLFLARPTPLALATGLVVVLAGEALRVWAAGHLTKTVELVTSGPYRYTRNPLYLGRLLIFTGLCAMARLPNGASWLVLLAGYAIFFGYYLPRKERVEPARLLEQHGESFARYYRSVPALFPALHPYDGPTSRTWSASRMLRNREPLMLLALLGVSLFLLWRLASRRS